MVVGMLSLGLGPACLAKSVPVPFAGEYLSMVWGLEDGMPENSCSGIVPAPDGSLWLGTFRGLARFNGTGMARYAPPGMPELARLGVVNLHRETGGRIWVSTFSGLISYEEDGTWRRWLESDGWKAAGEYVRSYATRAGFDPILTRFGGQVYRLENGQFQELSRPPGASGGSWAALDDAGRVYVVRGGFAGFLQGDAWVALPLPPGFEGGLAGATQSDDGTALVVGRRTIMRYRDGRLVRSTPLSQPVTAFWQAFEDSTGTLWLPSISGGVYRVRPDGEVKRMRKADGLAHDGPARCVFEDDQGGIWLGSGGGGVARLTAPKFRYVGEHEGLLDAVTQSIAPMDAGQVLLGIYAVGLRVFDGTQIKPLLPPAADEVDHRVRTVIQGADGAIWIGATDRGLRRWDGTNLTSMGTELFATNSTLSSLFEDSQGRLWVGADTQVGVLEGGVAREIQVPGRGSRGGTVYFAQDGEAILLAHRRTIFRWTATAGVREWVQLPEKALVSGVVVDREGRIWVGTNGLGIFGYVDGELRHLGMADGLPSESVGSMILDNLGNLWFSCSRMAAQVEPGNLWRVAGPTPEESRLRILGESDGLRGLDFAIGTQPTVGKDVNGRLWFALVRGAAMVDPGRLNFRDRPPPISIESLRYVPRGGRLPVEVLPGSLDEPTLPAGIRQVEVHYTALDFAAPERHRFRVRLGGDRAEWQEMGGERSVVFFELPPGRHRVQVRAAGSDGVWNLEGAQLSFVVAPFFWQTLWFRASSLLAVLGLAGAGGWLASSRRLRQLNVQVALRQLATSLTAAIDAQTLGLRVAETCRALFRHQAFFLVLLDRQGSVRLVAHAEDTEPGDLAPKPVARGTLTLGSAIAPVLAGQPLLINRATDATMAAGETAPGGNWTGVGRAAASMLFAPIRWEENTIGVISVQSYAVHRYRQEDLDQLQMLAAHCGAAIARMEAEQLRRENEERLRLAMETASMGSWEIDLATGDLVASPEAEAVYGFAPGTMSGNMAQLWSRVPDSEASDIRRQIDAIRAGRLLALDVVHRVLAGDGERWLEVKGRVHGERGDGSAPRLIGITADISARKQAERLRDRLEEQLRQSQKQEAIGTLAGGIAHDFNNLLAVILGNIEAARSDVEPGHPVRESLDEIHKSGLRARDLVRRILAFSRPQDHLRKVVNLEPIVDEVAQLLRSTIPAGVEISTVFAEAVPAVMADPSQIHQVLLNLGTNAWHAIEGRAGQITFRLTGVTVDVDLAHGVPGLHVGPHALLQVVDTGWGMSTEVQSRIFDPFFTTKPPGKGTGLGLSVALAIIKSHGGTVSVDSAVGRGTTFSIYLPEAARSPGEEPASAATSTASAVRRGARILFVDDEESLVRLTRRVLERAGYEVEACVEVRDALARFSVAPEEFDVVITDLSMPGFSGLEFARDVLRLRPGVAMLLCSGNLSESEIAEALAMGMRAVLTKPYSSAELLATIADILADPRTGATVRRQDPNRGQPNSESTPTHPESP
jgi:PAS domain S-box-containing protein